MTKNESRVYKFVDDFISMYKFSPSYKEIAEQLNFASPSQAHKICMQLVKKGKLTKGEGARNLEIL
jgi:SOS-response transcriptional repressor LexA